MKKYLKFFIIFLLISSIPAVFFFLFPNAASNINSGDIPSFDGSKNEKSDVRELQGSHYLIRLTPVRKPLKKGEQGFRLEILNRGSGSHWDGMPLVRVRGSEAGFSPVPVTVEQLRDKGNYRVKVNFPDSGAWNFELDLKKPDETLSIPLYVPAAT